MDLQRSRQKSKKAYSSKVSNLVWQHQVTGIFQTKFSYACDSVKMVSECGPLLGSHTTARNRDSHTWLEVRCVWNIDWLKIPLTHKNACAKARTRTASSTSFTTFSLASHGTRPAKAIPSAAGSLPHSVFSLTGTCWTCGAATVWTVAGVNVWMVPLAACVSTRWACTVCTCCWMVTGWTWEDVTRLWTWGWRTGKQKRDVKK